MRIKLLPSSNNYQYFMSSENLAVAAGKPIRATYLNKNAVEVSLKEMHRVGVAMESTNGFLIFINSSKQPQEYEVITK